MAHAITSADSTDNAVECIECGVICQDEERVISRDADGRETTAFDLLPRCPGVGPLPAHHFAPADEAIVCDWCQAESAPNGPEAPRECIRPE